MRPLCAFLALIMALLCAMPVGAEDVSIRIVFPAGQALSMEMDGVITVEDALLQMQLPQGQIVSVQRGARFSIAKPDTASDAMHLNVLSGTLTLIDIESNALTQLPPGSYLVHPAGISIRPGDPASHRTRDSGGDPEMLVPGYRLSDAVMTQQQKYLDSLKVDIRDINHALASLLRRLLFK